MRHRLRARMGLKQVIFRMRRRATLSALDVGRTSEPHRRTVEARSPEHAVRARIRHARRADLTAHAKECESRSVASCLLTALLMWALVWAPHAGADATAEAIRGGGVALLMRHATAPGTFDPPGFRLDDCATQRNLSAEGRREAQRIGSYLKRIGLNPGEVLTSQWCRARDTANLAFGASRDWPALDSFIRSPHTERTQVGAVLSRIAQIKPGDRPLVLVTHQVVITAVTGIYPDSGEIVVVAPDAAPGKGVKVVGRLDPDRARPR